MRCLCGCPIYPWNNHQSEVSCPTNVTPPPASLWWALKCCPHGADVSPTVWRPFLPIEVLSHFHPHIIYSQPRFHNEWSAMFQAVPTRRGLEPWPCALGQCTGQACKEMTHRHGNPRPLPSVINAHVGPHVQHYAKAILSVTQVSWSKTCGGESFDVNKWGARVNGARLQLSNLSNLYFQRR